MLGLFGYLRVKHLTANKMVGSVVVWHGISAFSFLFLFRFQNTFCVFKILFGIHTLLIYNCYVKMHFNDRVFVVFAIFTLQVYFCSSLLYITYSLFFIFYIAYSNLRIVVFMGFLFTFRLHVILILK